MPCLRAGTIETLLGPENKGQLTDILLYHVDDRVLIAANIPAGSNYFKPLLTVQRLCITSLGDKVMIADRSGSAANVIIADIKADNGVIHVIEKVLIPGTRLACHQALSKAGGGPAAFPLRAPPAKAI